MKLKRIIAFLIGSFPLNIVRVFLYSKLFGYHIQKSHIGWFTVICVDNARIISCKIGCNNRFIGPMQLLIKKGVSIRINNTFECGNWTKLKPNSRKKYLGMLEIGEGTRISTNNYFDIAGSLLIGDNCIIGGKGSQFWTHGAGVNDRDIEIGNNCYIGSSVKFAPGSSIGNNTLVAMGSVVTKIFSKDYVLLGGNPAKIMKESYDWEKKMISN